MLYPLVIFGQNKNIPKPTIIEWHYIGIPDFSADSVVFPSIAISPADIPYVAFRTRYYPFTVYVMKYNGNTWENVGTAGFIQGWVYRSSLAIDPSGTPYLAYIERSSLKISLVKFNGSSWVQVGAAGFSPFFVNSIALAINPVGIPYVTFVDGITSSTSVMKFDGNNWIYVGNSNFTPASPVSNIAFSLTSEIFAVFLNGAASSNLSVMNFNGSNWVAFGLQGPELSSMTYDISMAIGPDNLPYIPYKNDSSGKLSVVKNTGNNWQLVGANIFTNFINYAYIQFNQSGQPFIACDDSSYANVYSFDGTNWNHVGNNNFSNVPVNYMAFTLNSSGRPYIAFISQISRKLSVMKYDYPESIEQVHKNQLLVYPNPAIDKITIQLPKNENSNKTVEIYNATGNRLYETQTPENTIHLNVKNYPSGMYLIKIITGQSNSVARFCKL